MEPNKFEGKENDHILPKETLDAMEELGNVLKSIYLHMKEEGYIIENSVLKKKDGGDVKQ